MNTEKLTKIDDSLFKLVDFPYLDNNFDSLNEYEELCLLLEKLNETIDQVNILTDKIDDGGYDPSELITLINKVKTDLENEINTLNTTLTKQINDLEKSTNSKLLELSNTLTSKIEEVQSTLNTSISQVNTELNTKIEANTTLINSNKEATDASITTLTTTVNEVSTSVSEYDTKINDLTTKVNEVDTKVAGYDADISLLKEKTSYTYGWSLNVSGLSIPFGSYVKKEFDIKPAGDYQSNENSLIFMIGIYLEIENIDIVNLEVKEYSVGLSSNPYGYKNTNRSPFAYYYNSSGQLVDVDTYFGKFSMYQNRISLRIGSTTIQKIKEKCTDGKLIICMNGIMCGLK